MILYGQASQSYDCPAASEKTLKNMGNEPRESNAAAWLTIEERAVEKMCTFFGDQNKHVYDHCEMNNTLKHLAIDVYYSWSMDEAYCF